MSAVKAEIEHKDAIQLGVPGLGERLRSARLARDLDMAKMAERIHLTVDMVDSLEHDDYSEMPARVFVRGYIRNYARSVELPLDSVMAQFDAIWPDEDAPVRISPSPRLASDGRPDKGWHRVMTWLLVLVLLVLFLIWWQGYLDKFIGTWDPLASEPAPANTAREAPFEPVLGTDLLPLSPPAAEGNDMLAPPTSRSALPAPRDNALNPRRDQAAAAPTNQSDSGLTGQPAGSGISQPGPQAPAAIGADAISPEAAASPVETQPPTAAAVETVPPQVEGIRVRFTQDCWVDIRDSTRTFKLFGTMKRGTERTLEGEPPYRMVLGNAKGVEILVDGKPYDLSSETIANVARFTLSR